MCREVGEGNNKGRVCRSGHTLSFNPDQPCKVSDAQFTERLGARRGRGRGVEGRGGGAGKGWRLAEVNHHAASRLYQIRNKNSGKELMAQDSMWLLYPLKARGMGKTGERGGGERGHVSQPMQAQLEWLSSNKLSQVTSTQSAVRQHFWGGEAGGGVGRREVRGCWGLNYTKRKRV